MTCQECGDLMLEVARRRAAPFVERAVVVHTAGCADCARRLDRERSLTAGLRALAVADAAPPSHGLEQRLAGAFAALQREAARPAAPESMRRWFPVAAGLVLAAGLATWRIVQPTPVIVPEPGRQAAAARTLAAPLAGALPAAAPVPAAAPGAAHASAAARRPRPFSEATAAGARRAATAQVSPPSVQPADFTPIPAAAGLPDFESGEIVRLGIPVTALPNYGLDMPAGEQSAVQADLLIGQDGQARAIRLVVATPEDARPRP